MLAGAGLPLAVMAVALDSAARVLAGRQDFPAALPETGILVRTPEAPVRTVLHRGTSPIR
jgi:hypothetical protein